MKSITVGLMCGVLGSSGLAIAAEDAPVRIFAYAEHRQGNFVYHYRVTNFAQDKIGIVTVGFNASPEVDSFELNELPMGWTLESGTPHTSATAPYGWEAEAVLQEESLFRAMEWSVIDLSSPYILPGQNLGGMSVTLRKSDSAYLTAHANIVFSSGHTQPLTVPIESLDTTPPQLSVRLDPSSLWPPNNKSIPISATITVKDDYDGEPAIKLESITANEPLDADDIADAQFGTDDRQFQLTAKRSGNNGKGRIYTVTYSATDASGNKATANATVVVPHDQGNQ